MSRNYSIRTNCTSSNSNLVNRTYWPKPSEIVNIFVAVEGGTLWRKNKFSKKSLTMTKNWKGSPLGFLNTQCVEKYQRNWRWTLWREKKLEKSLTMLKKLKGRTLWGFFSIDSVAKHQKIEEGKIFIFEKKILQCRKDERGTIWVFPTSILSQNSKKIEGGLFGEFFSKKKVRSAEKIERGPFGLARHDMFRGKQEKPFWFSSLDQIVQFGAIIFCRDFGAIF